MGLVHDQHADGLRELRQHLLAETRRVKALRADQEQVQVVDARLDLLPLRHVRGVDRGRPDAGARGRFDLVAHQSEQGRDDDGRALARPAQKLRGDEVHRRFPPARALHHQHAFALVDKGIDGRPLVVSQHGVRPRDTLEKFVRLFACRSHGAHHIPRPRHGCSNSGTVRNMPDKEPEEPLQETVDFEYTRHSAEVELDRIYAQRKELMRRLAES